MRSFAYPIVIIFSPLTAVAQHQTVSENILSRMQHV